MTESPLVNCEAEKYNGMRTVRGEAYSAGMKEGSPAVCDERRRGEERPGFPCRTASKSGEYPHRENRAF